MLDIALAVGLQLQYCSCYSCCRPTAAMLLCCACFRAVIQLHVLVCCAYCRPTAAGLLCYACCSAMIQLYYAFRPTAACSDAVVIAEGL